MVSSEESVGKVIDPRQIPDQGLFSTFYLQCPSVNRRFRLLSPHSGPKDGAVLNSLAIVSFLGLRTPGSEMQVRGDQGFRIVEMRFDRLHVLINLFVRSETLFDEPIACIG